MKRIEFWKIYSFWVLGMYLLWVSGYLPFSPLASALVSFIGTLYVFRGITPAYLFILFTHGLPLITLQNAPLDLIPNLFVFLLYSMVLAANGTNFVTVYRDISDTFPVSIDEYLRQRGIISL
jgi:hypothetical protein